MTLLALVFIDVHGLAVWLDPFTHFGWRDVLVPLATWGNVALDVTRILARTVDDLRGTDMADEALAALAHSPVTDIYLLGRRGPAQAAFTPKELKELGELAAADLIVRPEEIALTPADEVAITAMAVRRNLEVLHHHVSCIP